MMLTNRRHLLLSGGAGAGFLVWGRRRAWAADAAPASQDKSFAGNIFRQISEEDWQKRLGGDDIAYTVLRQEDTEDTFSSPFLGEHRVGVFHCKGCGLPLFESGWKYESHTGWPSFFDIIKTNVGTKVDHLIRETRTEYHCARCLGHQGHIFPDGPKPTGLRYCNNGASLTFKPNQA
jgi:peptide-methionine (R)-S-oxide reductase